MRALSEGWSIERKCHHRDDNQSPTFHELPPMIGLEGTRQNSPLPWPRDCCFLGCVECCQGCKAKKINLIWTGRRKVLLWGNNVPKMPPESVIEKGTGGRGRL